MNQQGHCYHIGIAPKQGAKWALITGDPGRVELIAAYLDDSAPLGQNREYTSWAGTLEGERVLVAVNADETPYTAHFDAGCGRAVDLITGQDHDFGGGSELPPYSVAFWKCER